MDGSVMVMLDNWELFKIAMIPLTCIGGFCAFVVFLFNSQSKREDAREKKEEIRHFENKRQFENLERKMDENTLKNDLRMEKFEKSLIESDMRKDNQLKSIVKEVNSIITKTKGEQDVKISKLQSDIDDIVRKQNKYDEDISLFKKVLEDIKSKVSQIINIKIAQQTTQQTTEKPPMEGHRLWHKDDNKHG